MRVICPACGCNLEPVPGAPLGRVACPDCGKRIDLRTLVPVPDEVPTADEPTAATAARPTGRRRGRPWAVPVAAATAAAVAAAATVVLVPGRPAAGPPAAVAARPDLLPMKTAADAMALRGDLAGAYAAYNRVLSAAVDEGQGGGGTDPVTAQVVQGARAAQDKVFAALLDARRSAAAAAAGPAAAAVVATTAPAAAVGPPAAREPFADFVPRSAVGVPPPPLLPATPAADDPVDAVLAAVDGAGPVAHPPASPRLHTYTLPDVVTDAQIGEAIDRAIVYLRANGGTGPPVAGRRPRAPVAPAAPPPPAAAEPSDLDGGSALGPVAAPPARPPPAGGARVSLGTGNEYGEQLLATYALLHAGQATDRPGLGVNDPAVKAALDGVKLFDPGGTYSRSLRATLLAVYNRPEDRATLEDDVRWLVAAQHDGGYTYGMRVRGDESFDNSNSQYGLLGVWSGAQAGIAVDGGYWHAVDGHWGGCERPAGTWGYGANDTPYLSMTLAGVASLLVTHEYLDASAEASGSGRPPGRSFGLDAGLAWLDQGDNCMAGIPDSPVPAYTLYGLERVGLASGFKFFGRHDWYAELAARLVAQQHADGSWNQGVIDTSYCLLFLARGRHPVLYNKLRYDGHWDDRPHDVAHLARYAAKQLERPLNWQVVNLRRNWFDWMDAPVLYVSGDAPPPMTDRDYAALRDFALGGGLIFTHADGGSPAFTAWVQQLVRRVFPKYELMTVPKDHPLNTVLYHLKDPPPLAVVTNGSRILLVHSPTDIAGGWHLNWTDEKAGDFRLGLNVFVYAAGKADYKNRQSSTFIPAPPAVPDRTVAVGRLRYAGEWDPEPYAWTRFARYFQWETRTGLDVQQVDLKALVPGQFPAAFLTGTVRQDFTPAEAAAARAYVEAGGVLVVDACGGAADFAKSVRTTLLPAAFPGAAVLPLAATHPVLVPGRPFADDLRGRLPLRPFASERLATADVPVDGLHVGRGWVLFSHLDLTSGLLGTSSWGILGYDPAYAQALVKNAILWADARAAAMAAASKG